MNTKKNKKPNDKKISNLTVPYFSIIIPTYNSYDSLSKLARAFSSQTFNDFEVIVVDDGSNENEKVKIKKLAVKYDFLTAYFIENNGPFFARVFGQKKAKGKFFLFFDSDDLIRDNALTKIHNITKINNPDVLFFNVVVNEIVWKPFDSFEIKKEKVIAKSFTDTLYGALWNKCFKSTLVDSFDYSYTTKFSNIKLGDDLLHNILLISHANSFCYLNYDCYIYNDNVNSLSHNIDYKRISSIYDVEYDCLLLAKTIVSCNLFKEILLSRLLNTINSLSNISKKGYRLFVSFLSIIRNSKYFKLIIANVSLKNILPFKYKIIFLLIRVRFYHLLAFLYIVKNIIS